MKIALIFAAFLAPFYLLGGRKAQAASIDTVTTLPSAESQNDEPAPTSASSAITGIDNNNPLNIRVTSDQWQGLADPRQKKGFFNFVNVVWGFRAAAKIILGAYAERGLKTLDAVITQWAPPTENNTAGYIDFVVRKTGLSKNTIITRDNIAIILQAMAKMEVGKDYDLSTINTGLNLL
jgi:hypothetical protein